MRWMTWGAIFAYPHLSSLLPGVLKIIFAASTPTPTSAVVTTAAAAATTSSEAAAATAATAAATADAGDNARVGALEADEFVGECRSALVGAQVKLNVFGHLTRMNGRVSKARHVKDDKDRRVNSGGWRGRAVAWRGSHSIIVCM